MPLARIATGSRRLRSQRRRNRRASLLFQALEPRLALSGNEPFLYEQVGEPIQVVNYNDGAQFGRSIAVAASGVATVVWTDGYWSQGLDGSTAGVYARRFDANGNPLGNQFRVNQRTEGAQDRPAIGLDGQGRAVVAYLNCDYNAAAFYNNFTNYDVRVQRLMADGTRGSEVVIPLTDGYLYPQPDRPPAIAVDPDGSFTVAYWDSPDAVAIRRYDSANNLLLTRSMTVKSQHVEGRRSVVQHMSDMVLSPDGSSVTLLDAELVSQFVVDVGEQVQGTIRVNRLSLDGVVSRHTVFQSPWEPAREASQAGSMVHGNYNAYVVCVLGDGSYFWGARRLDAPESSSGTLVAEKRAADGRVVMPLTSLWPSSNSNTLTAITALPDGNVLFQASTYTPWQGAMIEGLILGRDNAPLGDAFRLTSNRYGDPLRVAVAGSSGDRLAATWNAEHPWLPVGSDADNGVPLVFFNRVAAAQAPVFSSGSTAVVAENTPIVTAVYTATATAVGPGAAVAYEVKPGVGDADLIAIDATTGVVTLKAVADYETKAAYTFTVVARNTAAGAARSAELPITIDVTNVNESPIDLGLSSATTAENGEIGATIGTLVATDVDSDEAFVYTLVPGEGDADNSAFTVVGNRVQAAQSFDYESRSAYTIRVKVTDAGGLSLERAFSITIIDSPLRVNGVVASQPGVVIARQRAILAASFTDVVTVRGKPQVQLQVGPATRTAAYVSGSGSRVLLFEYVPTALESADTVRLGQKFVFPKNSGISAGTDSLAAELPTEVAGAVVAGIRIDAAPPKTIGVGVPGKNTYTVGQTLDFVVRFSETVMVNGSPRISLTGLNGARHAAYVSGSGTQELTFRYVVQAGDAARGKKGLGLAKSITLASGATITDEASNRAVLKLSAATIKGIKIDTRAAAASLRSVVTNHTGGPTGLSPRAVMFASFG